MDARAFDKVRGLTILDESRSDSVLVKGFTMRIGERSTCRLGLGNLTARQSLAERLVLIPKRSACRVVDQRDTFALMKQSPPLFPFTEHSLNGFEDSLAISDFRQGDILGSLEVGL